MTRDMDDHAVSFLYFCFKRERESVTRHTCSHLMEHGRFDDVKRGRMCASIYYSIYFPSFNFLVKTSNGFLNNHIEMVKQNCTVACF